MEDRLSKREIALLTLSLLALTASGWILFINIQEPVRE